MRPMLICVWLCTYSLNLLLCMLGVVDCVVGVICIEVGVVCSVVGVVKGVWLALSSPECWLSSGLSLITSKL